MAGIEEEGKRPGKFIIQKARENGKNTAGLQLASFLEAGRGGLYALHDERVRMLTGFICSWQEKWYEDHQVHFTPLQIIRNNLGWSKDLGDDQTRQSVTPIAMAWNALAYEYFEPGTSGEQATGMELEMYYQGRRDPVIRLSETQAQVINVLAEAVDIPHRRGQTEIEIPEKLRNYSRWFHSKEYQALVAEARSKKTRS